MSAIAARLRLLGPGVLELILLGLAVGFALVTATAIALNANSEIISLDLFSSLHFL